MILILELATLVLALVFCWQQLKQLLALTIKKEDSKKPYNPENYKAGCYQVRWH